MEVLRGADAERDLRRPVVQLALVGTAVVLGLLPVLGLPLALLVLAGLGVWTVIAWFQRFDLLLHLLVLSVFVESVGIGPARVGRVLAATAVAALVARAAFTPWRPRLAHPLGALLPVAAFLVWAWASGMWATDTGAWAYAMGQLALAMAYFVTVALLVERRSQVFDLLRTMVLGALFASGVAFAQVLAGAPRAEGLQGDPNIYALYQVASLPAAALLATNSAAGRRWLGWVAIPVILVSIMATQSRGGLATAVGVLVVMFARGDFGERLRRHRAAAVTTALLAAAGVLAAVMTFNRRFSPERVLSDRASGRFDIWYVAFREWQDNLLVGIGGGGFKPRSVELLATEPGVQLVKSHLLLSDGIEVHNIYLETLVEYGLIGFLLFVAVLVSTGVRLQAAAQRSRDPALRALPMVLLAFLAASFFLSVVNNKLLWILIGLGVVVAGNASLGDGQVPGPPDRRAARGMSEVPRSLAATCLLLLVVPPAVAASTAILTPQSWMSSVQFVVHTSAPPREREAAVRTLETLVASRVVAEDVLRRTQIDMHPRELVDRLVVEREPDTLVFTATVEDTDRGRSEQLMRGLTTVFPARVDQLRATDEGGSYALRIWGGGAVTTRAGSSPLGQHAALGVAFGALLSLLVLALWRRRRARWGPAPHLGRLVPLD